MADTPIVFVDGMTEANVLHGVVRMTLSQATQDGKALPAVQICMPLVQVAGFVGGLTNLLRQVEARIKDARAAQPQGKAPTAEPMPSAFTFGDGR